METVVMNKNKTYVHWVLCLVAFILFFLAGLDFHGDATVATPHVLLAFGLASYSLSGVV